ncbi:MAG: hypothetical protein II684_05200 [Treponema sp.]|nr:hypothetical protein [Alphaproteobacteria bacterium]MBQ3966207.1 hypothetical protein [Treponema sp.]
MNEQEKQILLQDLCARLRYGVVCRTSVGDYRLLGIDVNIGNVMHLDSPIYDEGDGYFDMDYQEVKPYLRPMSSMTEDEKKELEDICTMYNGGNHTDYESFGIEILITHPGYGDSFCQDFTALDWLNANHFDFRNLVGKGLAIDCTDLNIY